MVITRGGILNCNYIHSMEIYKGKRKLLHGAQDILFIGRQLYCKFEWHTLHTHIANTIIDIFKKNINQ